MASLGTFFLRDPPVPWVRYGLSVVPLQFVRLSTHLTCLFPNVWRNPHSWCAPPQFHFPQHCSALSVKHLFFCAFLLCLFFPPKTFAGSFFVTLKIWPPRVLFSPVLRSAPPLQFFQFQVGFQPPRELLALFFSFCVSRLISLFQGGTVYCRTAIIVGIPDNPFFWHGCQ